MCHCSSVIHSRTWHCASHTVTGPLSAIPLHCRCATWSFTEPSLMLPSFYIIGSSTHVPHTSPSTTDALSAPRTCLPLLHLYPLLPHPAVIFPTISSLHIHLTNTQLPSFSSLPTCHSSPSLSLYDQVLRTPVTFPYLPLSSFSSISHAFPLRHHCYSLVQEAPSSPLPLQLGSSHLSPISLPIILSVAYMLVTHLSIFLLCHLIIQAPVTQPPSATVTLSSPTPSYSFVPFTSASHDLPCPCPSFSMAP